MKKKKVRKVSCGHFNCGTVCTNADGEHGPLGYQEKWVCEMYGFSPPAYLTYPPGQLFNPFSALYFD